MLMLNWQKYLLCIWIAWTGDRTMLMLNPMEEAAKIGDIFYGRPYNVNA